MYLWQYTHLCADTCSRFLGDRVMQNKARNYSDPIVFPDLWNQAFPDSPATAFQSPQSAKPTEVASEPSFRQALAEIPASQPIEPTSPATTHALALSSTPAEEPSYTPSAQPNSAHSAQESTSNAEVEKASNGASPSQEAAKHSAQAFEALQASSSRTSKASPSSKSVLSSTTPQQTSTRSSDMGDLVKSTEVANSTSSLPALVASNSTTSAPTSETPMTSVLDFGSTRTSESSPIQPVEASPCRSTLVTDLNEG